MNIIHGNESEIPTSLVNEEKNKEEQMNTLLDFSLAVDKYKLQESVRKYLGAWMHDFKSVGDEEDPEMIVHQLCLAWIYKLDTVGDWTRKAILEVSEREFEEFGWGVGAIPLYILSMFAFIYQAYPASPHHAEQIQEQRESRSDALRDAFLNFQTTLDIVNTHPSIKNINMKPPPQPSQTEKMKAQPKRRRTYEGNKKQFGKKFGSRNIQQNFRSRIDPLLKFSQEPGFRYTTLNLHNMASKTYNLFPVPDVKDIRVGELKNRGYYFVYQAKGFWSEYVNDWKGRGDGVSDVIDIAIMPLEWYIERVDVEDRNVELDTRSFSEKKEEPECDLTKDELERLEIERAHNTGWEDSDDSDWEQI